MQGLLKVYRITACIVFGALLAAGLVLGVLSLVAPDVVMAAWSRGSREIAPGMASSLEIGPTAPAGGLLPASPAAPPARDRAGERKDAVDVGALEARLRLLDRALPPWKLEPGSAGASSSNDAGRLSAWESLRLPLLRFLNAAGGSREAGERFAEDASIESIAQAAAGRLEKLRAEYSGVAARILKGIEPSAIARLLADDRTVAEERARFILARLSSSEATEVIERLSRLAPARAARLLEGLMRMEENVDG